MKKENLISKNIIWCAIEVHKTLGGPGLLESVYEEALTWELKQNHKVDRQVELPIVYKSQKIGTCSQFWNTVFERWNSSCCQWIIV